MKKTGKIKVSNKLAGAIKSGRTTYRIPTHYNLSPRQKFNNKECEFELDGGQVIHVWVEGKELPIDTSALAAQEAKEQRKKEKAERQKRAKEAKQKNAALTRALQGDSFHPDKMLAPNDTQEIMRESAASYEYNNFLLKFQKFARYEKTQKTQYDGKFSFFKKGRGRNAESYEIKANFDRIDFRKIADKQRQSATSLLEESHQKTITFEPNWRLILGLGGHSVYEISMTLHHIHGFPYLPASSVKGVVRSWVIQNVFGEQKIPSQEQKYPLLNAEYRAYQDEGFCRIFGCPSAVNEIVFDSSGEPLMGEKGKYKTRKQEVVLKNAKGKGAAHQGNMLFFDAFPFDEPSIEVDVMNPHYGPYYGDKSGRTAPTDFHNPIPVFFLTVRDCAFQFVIGVRKNAGLDSNKLQELLEQTATYLEQALTQHGIGAKTAVGYGYMNPS